MNVYQSVKHIDIPAEQLLRRDEDPRGREIDGAIVGPVMMKYEIDIDITRYILTLHTGMPIARLQKFTPLYYTQHMADDDMVIHLYNIFKPSSPAKV